MLEFLQAAKMFFVFGRSWWNGSGYDVAVWWIDDLGGHRNVYWTGEVLSPTESELINSADISTDEVLSVFRALAATGIDKVKSQPFSHVTTHFDDYYGIKWTENANTIWIEVAGGIHKDPRAIDALVCVGNLCPKIFPETGDFD